MYPLLSSLEIRGCLQLRRKQVSAIAYCLGNKPGQSAFQKSAL